MNEDRDLDVIVASAARVTDVELEAFLIEGITTALREAIVNAPATSRSTPKVRRHPRRRRRVAALASIVALVAGTLLLGPQLGGSDRGQWAAAAVAAADSAPRILVELPGWEVTDADELNVGRGELGFSDGDYAFRLTWGPRDTYDFLIEDRSAEPNEQTTTTVLGHPATIFTYQVDGIYAYRDVIWSQGDHYVELRDHCLRRTPLVTYTVPWTGPPLPGGGIPESELKSQPRQCLSGVFNAASFDRLLASLRLVDVDTWLAAMPASAVKPIDRARVVAEMLRDIPLPPGFDTADLKNGKTVSDRYQLGARVTGAIACAWIERWSSAVDRGNTIDAQGAIDAMATSKNWAILLEMQDQGGWTRKVWRYADAMANDGILATTPAGPTITIPRDHPPAGLGCRK